MMYDLSTRMVRSACFREVCQYLCRREGKFQGRIRARGSVTLVVTAGPRYQETLTMFRFLPTLAATSALALAAFALPISSAHATGPFDGTWIIDVPSDT